MLDIRRRLPAEQVIFPAGGALKEEDSSCCRLGVHRSAREGYLGEPDDLEILGNLEILEVLENPVLSRYQWTINPPRPTFVPTDAILPCVPRNITPARGRLLQISAF